MSPIIQHPYEEYLWDSLEYSNRTEGDYSTIEYAFIGSMGNYRLRIGDNIVDSGKVIYVMRNNKNWLYMYPTKNKRVFVAKDEQEGDILIFRFEGTHLNIYKRKYIF